MKTSIRTTLGTMLRCIIAAMTIAVVAAAGAITVSTATPTTSSATTVYTEGCGSYNSGSAPSHSTRFYAPTAFTCHFWSGVVSNDGQGVVNGVSPALFGSPEAANALQLYAGKTITLGAAFQDISTGFGAPHSCGNVYMPAGWTLGNPNTLIECGYWIMGVQTWAQADVTDIGDWFIGDGANQWHSPESDFVATCLKYGCTGAFISFQPDGQFCTAASLNGVGLRAAWCSMNGAFNPRTNGWTSNTKVGWGVCSFTNPNWCQSYMDGYALNDVNWGYENQAGVSTGAGDPTCWVAGNCPPYPSYTFVRLDLQATGNLVSMTAIGCAGGAGHFCTVLWDDLTQHTFNIPVDATPGSSYYDSSLATGTNHPGAYDNMVWFTKSGTLGAVNACRNAVTAYLQHPPELVDTIAATSDCTASWCYPPLTTNVYCNVTRTLPGPGGAFFAQAAIVSWVWEGRNAPVGNGAAWTNVFGNGPAEYTPYLAPPGETASISASPTTLTTQNSTTITATIHGISDLAGTYHDDSFGVATLTDGAYNASAASTFAVPGGTCSPRTRGVGVYTFFTCTVSTTVTNTTPGSRSYYAHTSSAGNLASTTVTWYQPTADLTFSQPTAPSAPSGQCRITSTTIDCPINEALDIGLGSTWLDPSAPVDPATSFAVDKTAQTGTAPPSTSRILVGGPSSGKVPSPSTGSCSGQFSNRELYACTVTPGSGYHDTTTSPSTQTVQGGIFAGSSTTAWLTTGTTTVRWWGPPASSIVLSPTTTTEGRSITVSAKAAALGGGSDAWYTPTTIYACGGPTDTVIAATTIAASTDPTAGGTAVTPTVAVTQPTVGTQTFTAYDVETDSGQQTRYAPRLAVGASCSPLASNGADAGWVLSYSAVTTARYTALLPT